MREIKITDDVRQIATDDLFSASLIHLFHHYIMFARPFDAAASNMSSDVVFDVSAEMSL